MLKRKIRLVTFSTLLSLSILLLFSISVMANSGDVAPPISSHDPGFYYKEQTVTLNSTTPGTQIYYTTDGSLPTNNSILYTGPISVKEDLIIKAIAVRGNGKGKAFQKNNGKTESEIATFKYQFVTRQDIADQFLSFTYNNMPYRLYVPANYDASVSYPLVLFLHGGGERGTDNQRQLLANDGAVIWAAPENQAKNPAFVLAPQARNVHDGGFGITRNSDNLISLERVFEFSQDLELAYEILQKVIGEYNIDMNRLYSTGISQGGFGTFNLNNRYPDLFAAMVPIAGGGNPETAHVLKDKPLWAFHAVDDIVIPYSYTSNAITAIKAVGGNPIYTEYPAEFGYNHASWNPAYENKEMIEWMFQQVKPD
jgi:predicted peptidase